MEEGRRRPLSPDSPVLSTDRTLVREDRGRPASQGHHIARRYFSANWAKYSAHSEQTSRRKRPLAAASLHPRSSKLYWLAPPVIVEYDRNPIIAPPNEQRHDAHGRHQRAYAESHSSHWNCPDETRLARTPIDTIQARPNACDNDEPRVLELTCLSAKTPGIELGIPAITHILTGTAVGPGGRHRLGNGVVKPDSTGRCSLAYVPARMIVGPLYWQIGRDILARQKEHGWGAKVIDRLAARSPPGVPGHGGLLAPEPEIHAGFRWGLA